MQFFWSNNIVLVLVGLALNNSLNSRFNDLILQSNLEITLRIDIVSASTINRALAENHKKFLALLPGINL